MKRPALIMTIPLALLLGSPLAVAQTAPPTTTKTPEAGANSFTEAQAKNRLEKAGYTQVTGLKKDEQGIWRGTASKGGAKVNVSVDFRGNIATK